MSVYDIGGGRGRPESKPESEPESRQAVEAEPELAIGASVFLATEYYSPADAGLQVFQVRDTDPKTGEIQIINLDTGSQLTRDADELVPVDSLSDPE